MVIAVNSRNVNICTPTQSQTVIICDANNRRGDFSSVPSNLPSKESGSYIPSSGPRLMQCLLHFCISSCISMTGCSNRSGQPTDSKAHDGSKSIATTPNADPQSEQPTNPKVKMKEEQAEVDKKKEGLRLEEEKNQAMEAIRNAADIQAPPFGKGTPKEPTWSKMDDFAQRMRDLGSNEFKFREAKNSVFRSTFNQKNIKYSPEIKWFLARNAVVSSGKYDFETGYFSFDLILSMRKKTPQGWNRRPTHR